MAPPVLRLSASGFTNAAWSCSAPRSPAPLLPCALGPGGARFAGAAALARRDLELDFAYVATGVAFDPFEAVGDLFDSALEGGAKSIDDLNSALDGMRSSMNFDRGLKTWRDYGGGSSASSGY